MAIHQTFYSNQIFAPTSQSQYPTPKIHKSLFPKQQPNHSATSTTKRLDIHSLDIIFASAMRQSDQPQQQTFINIKIKTLNHSIYEIIVNPLRFIKLFQHQIEQKTHVPIDAQRLLYRGFVLDPEKTLADYRIEEGNIIQLVANKIPSQVSHHSSLKRTEMNRANSYNKQHNKTKKFRQLQERINGFRIRKEESLEVLQQNKHTIDQLVECLNLNFMQDVSPFKMERRKLEIGEWVDVRDASGQWIEGQVINQYGEYVFIHFNGWDNRWNEWVSASSERIMPFRTHTVQLDKAQYMSPCPSFQRQITTKNNSHFKTNIEAFVCELTNTMDNLNSLLKDMQFSNKQFEADESLKNVSNISIPNLYANHHQAEGQVEQVEQNERKQEFQTPNKENHLIGDNISNKCEDDRSNKCDNDDISNKSYKSKRSEGLVDTASMKSLIIDESRKRQNKVFFDHTEEAQSVRSVKNKKSSRNINSYHQEYILEEEDSQNNEQEFEDTGLARKKELKRKMKASQLAPLLDRMGRLLIDIAPHIALLGHTDQSNNNFNQNLSTYTNEGSLLSKMSQMNKLNNHHHTSQANIPIPQQEHNQQDKVINNYCYFQVPVMLTPSELLKLNKVIESEKRNLQGL